MVIFQRLNFGPFFGLVVKNARLKFPPNKNPSVVIEVPIMRFSKMYILWPQLNQLGLVLYLLNSSKAHAPFGRPRFGRS